MEKNDNYVIYDDFSVSVKCQNCGKIDNLKFDHPQAIRINQIAGAGNHYLCLDCWKKQQDEKWEAIRKEKNYDIIGGQAVNLAVQISLAMYQKGELKKEKIMDAVNYWFGEMHNFLMKKYNEKNNNNQQS